MRRIPTGTTRLTELVEQAAAADRRAGSNDHLTALRDRLWAQEGTVRAAELWQQVRGEIQRRREELEREAAASRRHGREILDRLAREAGKVPPTGTTDFAAMFPSAFEDAYMEAAGALLGTVHGRGGPSSLAAEAQHEAFRAACVAAFNAGVRCVLDDWRAE